MTEHLSLQAHVRDAGTLLATAAQQLLLAAGEHEHTIVGYSLVKGLGDGEPVASERFSVGGHEWVSPCALASASGTVAQLG